MFSEHYLHKETKILPVKEQVHLLTKQFFLAFQQTDHLNHQLTEIHPPRGFLEIIFGVMKGIKSGVLLVRATVNDIRRGMVE